MKRKNEVGLVLEGGGSGGAFTTGVLDCFMEKGIRFPFVIGVSAGAMNGANFVAEQKGRARSTSIDIAKREDMISVKNFFSQQSIFDMEFMFDSLPNEIIPFDYDTYFQSKTRCVITTTDCETGRAFYLEERSDRERLMRILRASISLPFLAPIVDVDGMPCLDGAVGDSIPFARAMQEGYRKNVVVLTKPANYRKERSLLEKNMTILFYNKYPNFVRAMVNRYKRYNRQMEIVEKLGETGDALIIRPDASFIVSRTEKDYEPLMRLYLHGYELAEKMIGELRDFTKDNG